MFSRRCLQPVFGFYQRGAVERVGFDTGWPDKGLEHGKYYMKHVLIFIETWVFCILPSKP
ncbi:MAG TPA: hypothetical protein DCR43_04800 [Bacteroidales bacterium]|nr:MAG: hypothetical protein A2X09_01450 [Bacteroidetes bacterium GWF2_43_11]HAQ65158.1 hypothetical protein [Bacteroidales bacterium]HBZ65837.1 hypothetical protein [Bacteroidales bacterium]